MRTVTVIITLFSVVICGRLWPVLYRSHREHKVVWSVVLGILTAWNVVLLARALDAWIAR